VLDSRRGAARSNAFAEPRRGEITSFTHDARVPQLHPPSPLERAALAKTSAARLGASIRGLVASGLAQWQFLKLNQLLSFATIDDQRRGSFAAGEVKRTAFLAVEPSRLSRMENEANARR
jgi:hypothetical protein